MLEDLGKLIFAKGFKKFPKVQKFARSGHTVPGIGRNRDDFKELQLGTILVAV